MAREIYPALEAQHLAQGQPQIGWVFPAVTRSGHIEQGSAKNQRFKASEIVKKLCTAHGLGKKNGSKGN